MSGYFVPAGEGAAEYDERRSRFLGRVRPVSGEDEARAFVAEMKKKYYDARHNCWCYIIKDGPERYSDDGEPQGTAGVPMLEVFRREGVVNAACVVTRYFGGVLLGAGGLLRAYTRTAKEALDAAGVARTDRWTALEIPCPYALLERIKNETAAFGGAVEDVQYGQTASVRALLPEERAGALRGELALLEASVARSDATSTGAWLSTATRKPASGACGAGASGAA